jgi:hypothetical protein
MPKGSNQFTSGLVQAGLVCYVCERATPTLIDDVGGHVCQKCSTHMQMELLKHVLKQGYRVRKGGRS